jgi:hypothetical protein
MLTSIALGAAVPLLVARWNRRPLTDLDRRLSAVDVEIG